MDFNQLRPLLKTELQMTMLPYVGSSDYDSYRHLGVVDVLELNANGSSNQFWADLNNNGTFSEGTDYFVYTPKWVFCLPSIAWHLKIILTKYTTISHYRF